MGAPRGWETATPVYRLLSPLAGGLYLLVVLALSRERRLAPGWLTYGLLVTLGLIQLFFGYVENYSFAAVGVLAYLWLGLGVLNGRRPLWLAASVLALTNATHPSTVVLAPLHADEKYGRPMATTTTARKTSAATSETVRCHRDQKVRLARARCQNASIDTSCLRRLKRAR